MTSNGQTHLRELGKAYIAAGYPDRAGWPFAPDDQAGEVAIRELSAHGYVEPLAAQWRLTPAGLRAVMDIYPITEAAKSTLCEIREAYIQDGSPALEGWLYRRSSEARRPAVMELQSRGILRPSGTGYELWFLTNEGLRAILKDGTA